MEQLGDVGRASRWTDGCGLSSRSESRTDGGDRISNDRAADDEGRGNDCQIREHVCQFGRTRSEAVVDRVRVMGKAVGDGQDQIPARRYEHREGLGETPGIGDVLQDVAAHHARDAEGSHLVSELRIEEIPDEVDSGCRCDVQVEYLDPPRLEGPSHELADPGLDYRSIVFVLSADVQQRRQSLRWYRPEILVEPTSFIYDHSSSPG